MAVAGVAVEVVECGGVGGVDLVLSDAHVTSAGGAGDQAEVAAGAWMALSPWVWAGWPDCCMYAAGFAVRRPVFAGGFRPGLFGGEVVDRAVIEPGRKGAAERPAGPIRRGRKTRAEVPGLPGRRRR